MAAAILLSTSIHCIMKEIFDFPIALYLIAGIASLCFMIIIDFWLGPEAEHLNAWVIVNRLLGLDTGIPDSLAIRKLGISGALILTLAINMVIGAILMQLIRLIIFIIHS